jgi:hypothetical protein
MPEITANSAQSAVNRHLLKTGLVHAATPETAANSAQNAESPEDKHGYKRI